MKKQLVLFCLLTAQFISAQVKSQASPLQFQGKSVNAFTIELPQKLDYVKQLFNVKFEIDRFGIPKKNDQNFFFLQQIKLPKVTSSFLDIYYQLEETKTDNGSFVKVSLLISKGYDNFISKETDTSASQNILEMLNDLGISVERRNLEIQIAKKEQDVLAEKQKLILLEEELQAVENEKIELEKKLALKAEVLKTQAKTTQDMGNELQKIKTTLSEFEKNTTNKSKATLKSVSKQ
jgi:hypothetical protein